MLSDSEKQKLKRQWDTINSMGYNRHTVSVYYSMAKIVSREMKGNIGRVSCPTTRKFVMGWVEKNVI